MVKLLKMKDSALKKLAFINNVEDKKKKAEKALKGIKDVAVGK